MLGGQAANPPTPSCLTRQQIGDVALVASSLMLDAFRDGCRPHLAANAFLLRPAGTEYLARLRAEADRRFDSTNRLMASFFGGAPRPAEEIRGHIQALFAAGPAVGGIGTLDAPLCREIDEIIETMSPMSPEQSARFSAAFYSLILQVEARAAAARLTAAAAAAEGDTAAEGDAAAPAPNPPSGPPLPPICPE